MTTQHTPSDWIAHGTTIVHESPGGVEYTIASFADPKLPLEEQLANARLGAAAPQLLKAAISALDCLDEILEDTDDAEGHEGTMVPNPLLVQLRTAIAAATGKGE